MAIATPPTSILHDLSPLIIPPPPSTTGTTTSSNPKESTLIFLHGTSTSGPELASTPIRSLTLSQPSHPHPSPLPQPRTLSLAEALHTDLPTTRLIFPSGPPKHTTVLGRTSHAWFDVHSFTDRTVGEASQAIGLLESCNYLNDLVTSVSGQQVGSSGEIAIAGFSQGAAILVVLLLSGMLPIKLNGKQGVGGRRGVRRLVLISGWLPFRRQIWEAISEPGVCGLESKAKRNVAVDVVRALLGMGELEVEDKYEEEGWESLQVLLLHGRPDEKVRLEWMEEEVVVLKELGIKCEVVLYEELGHEIVREQVEELARFVGGHDGQ